MFVAFVDESGNDENSSVFSMAAILLSQFHAYHFGNDWRALLSKFGVSAFHATDFHGGRGEFRSWSDSDRASLTSTVVDLFLDYEVKHSGVVVPKNGYQRSYVDTGFHKSLPPATTKWKKPYLQAFMHTVCDLRDYARHQPTGLFITPVFDQCQEFIGQAKQDYSRINRDGRLGEMFVASTREYPQLQAADFMAWEYRVGMERRLVNNDRSPNSTMQALLPHMFNVQIWTEEFLDYFRLRVVACLSGQDPEAIPAPGPSRT